MRIVVSLLTVFMLAMPLLAGATEPFKYIGSDTVSYTHLTLPTN